MSISVRIARRLPLHDWLRWTVPLALVLFVSLTAAAQQVSLENLLSVPFPTELVAGNGRVAWVANAEGVRNVWVAEAPEYKARQLTTYSGDDGIEIGELSFTPDGRSIVFTRGGDLDAHRESPNPAHRPEVPEQAIWMASLRDGSVKRLAEGNTPEISPRGDRVAYIFKQQLMAVSLDGGKPDTLVAVAAPRSEIRWSPDATRIAFVSQRKEHSFIGLYDVAGKSIAYLDPSVDRDASPVWSPDSKRIAFVRVASRQQVGPFAQERSGTPWSIRVADVSTGAGRELWRADNGDGSVFHADVADSQLVWATGDRIVFPWERDGWLHLYSIPLTGGRPQLLTPGEFEVEHVSTSSDGREVVYSSNQGDIDRRHTWRVPSDGSKAPVALTSGRGNEWSPRFADAASIAIIHSGAQAPPIVAMIAAGRASRDLTAAPPQFPLAQLVEPQQVIFSAADGMKIHGQLFLPRGMRAGEKHAAAVFFHGGSRRQMLLGWHYGYYYRNAYAMNQFLASRGYVVLSVNYRSGIGYGMKFREAENYGTRGASEVNDVIGAALYLQSRGGVDPDRIAAWGGSYGGFLTAFALAKASNLYAAGVDMHGVHDWTNVLKTREPSYDPNSELGRLAWRSSPMAYVDTWKSPVLLIQGDDDRNVPFTETIHMAEELRNHGVEVEQLVFPDEVHDFLLHRDWLAAYRASADFLDRKVGERRATAAVAK
jgi:dipeptidyl aminopeptidase/acylaminoacyl peptidase